MTLTKVFQKFISNIFISIVQQESEWIIYSKVVKNGVIKNKFSKNFEINDNVSLPTKMKKYLEQLQSDYSFSYIALFLDSMGQNAIHGTTAEDYEKHCVDIKNVTYFNIDKTWSVYASFIDINWVKKLFSDVGIDFIYSPFIVQSALIKKEKLKQKATLYILNHNDSVTISVFKDGNLLFGAFFKTITDDSLTSGDEEDWEIAEEEDSIDNSIELDDMGDNNIEAITELSDLSELEELDSQNDNASFEDIKDDGNDFESEYESEESDLELYGRDIIIYKYLSKSLKEYYQNPLYQNYFIETVVLFDGYEVSSELISMIEDELFMDVEMNKIDINEIVCDMSIQEALL